MKPNGGVGQIILAVGQNNAFNGLFGVSGKLIFVTRYPGKRNNMHKESCYTKIASIERRLLGVGWTDYSRRKKSIAVLKNNAFSGLFGVPGKLIFVSTYSGKRIRMLGVSSDTAGLLINPTRTE